MKMNNTEYTEIYRNSYQLIIIYIPINYCVCGKQKTRSLGFILYTNYQKNVLELIANWGMI